MTRSLPIIYISILLAGCATKPSDDHSLSASPTNNLPHIVIVEDENIGLDENTEISNVDSDKELISSQTDSTKTVPIPTKAALVDGEIALEAKEPKTISISEKLERFLAKNKIAREKRKAEQIEKREKRRKMREERIALFKEKFQKLNLKNSISKSKKNEIQVSDNDLETEIDPISVSSLSVQSSDDEKTHIEDRKVPKTGKMTIRELVHHTMDTNPTIQIAVARKEDARIAVDIEKTSKMPTIDLTVSSGIENVYTTTTETRDINRNEANLAINQTVYNFGKTENAVKRREALYESAKLNYNNTSENVIFDVIKSYINYLRQKELVSLARKNVSAHQRISNLVDLQEKGGNATKADVKRAATRLDSAKSNKLENDRVLKDATNTFKRLTKLNPDVVIRSKKLFSASHHQTKNNSKNDVSNNPKLRALEAERKALEKQLKSSRSANLPELFVTGEANLKENVTGETDKASDFRGMFGFRVRLFDGGRNALKMEQIQNRMLESEASHKKLYSELVEDYQQNVETISTNSEKVVFLQESVKSARDVTKLYAEQFETGSRKPLELLDAQRDLNAAEQGLLNHRYDSSIAQYQTRKINGTLVNYLSKGK